MGLNMRKKYLSLALVAAACIAANHFCASYITDIAVIILASFACILLAEDAKTAAVLRKNCETDSLTGLKNKACCEHMIKEKYCRAECVGVIFWDINRLKSENDRLGHKAGDELIKKMAESLIAVSDETCEVFRYGGDEFLLIAENSSEAHLKSLCGKWCGSTDISASFGYACGNGDEIEDIINAADFKMYQSKRKQQ